MSSGTACMFAVVSLLFGAVFAYLVSIELNFCEVTFMSFPSVQRDMSDNKKHLSPRFSQIRA